MDAIDRQIVAELQDDGRLTVTDLAGRVGLSVSPTLRRLRDLEHSGVIRGYRAVLDGDALGLTFQALVFVTMRQEDRETLLAFEEAVAAIPNVLQAQRLFGDPDYLLRVATADLNAYAQLEDDQLATLPGVQRLNSTLVMKNVVGDRGLPTGARREKRTAGEQQGFRPLPRRGAAVSNALIDRLREDEPE